MADNAGLRTTGIVTGLALLLLLFFPYDGEYNQPVIENTVLNDNDNENSNESSGNSNDSNADTILTFDDGSDDTIPQNDEDGTVNDDTDEGTG
ncbi:MAG: hypothetical protein NZ517_02345, partial [Candidatus Nitrosocaldus sp.]|nr:hypothetical protein [Candidatus Nitrosocaldus sp.]